jgi:hypothetical protein
MVPYHKSQKLKRMLLLAISGISVAEKGNAGATQPLRKRERALESIQTFNPEVVLQALQFDWQVAEQQARGGGARHQRLEQNRRSKDWPFQEVERRM